MKKIVIIGGTSALASYLIPSLSKNYELITMGRKNCDIFCDLNNNTNSIDFPDNTDVVIHCAAGFGTNTDEEILSTEEVNAVGTLKVSISAYKARVKHLIIISSIYSILNENSLYYSLYSISKKHAEDLAIYYCKNKNIPLTVLRPSQIYDKKGCFRKHQQLLYLMADNAQLGKDINIFGSNDALRNYIHVEDLVEIIIRTVKTETTGLYSCINPKDVKLSDIAESAFLAFNNGGSILFLEDKENIPDNVFPCDTTLYNKIDFYPEIDIIKGMKKLYQYRMANK